MELQLPTVLFRPWMTFLCFVVGAAIQEEIIFRGLLQTTLAQRIPATLSFFGTSLSYASIIVALLFGLIHLKINPITAAALCSGFFRGNSDTEAVVSCRRSSSTRSLMPSPPFYEWCGARPTAACHRRIVIDDSGRVVGNPSVTRLWNIARHPSTI